jgi:hypothetical protein
MPSKQTAANPERSSSSGRKQPPVSAATASASASRASTGVRDENYALVSVLYHALQGAETIDQYIEDARSAEDDELVEFFEQTKETYVDHAAEAKALLAARLEGSEEDEEEGDDEEEEDEEEDEDED